jgi:hypothetical protein
MSEAGPVNEAIQRQGQTGKASLGTGQRDGDGLQQEGRRASGKRERVGSWDGPGLHVVER